MRARYVAGVGIEEVLDPDGVSWKKLASEHLKLEGTPLGLQPTGAIRSSWSDRKIGAVSGLDLAAVHDGEHLAFRLEWADPTENGAMDDNDHFADAAAVALPVAEGAPLVTMGAPGQPVNAWYWRADAEHGRHVVADGIGTSRTLDEELVRARGVWRDGRWKVVIARALRVESAEPVVQLAPGGRIGFGVAVWDGGGGERAGIKAVSGFEWRTLELEASPAVGRQS